MKNRSYWVAAGFSLLFCILLVVIFFLFAYHVVTGQMAGLMVVALIGLYFGFGVLIAVYRLVGKLE